MMLAHIRSYPQFYLFLLSAANATIWFKYNAIPSEGLMLFVFLQLGITLRAVHLLRLRKVEDILMWLVILAGHATVFGIFFERFLFSMR